MAKNNANQDNIIIQKLNNIISALSEIKRKNSQTESYSKRRKKSKSEIFHFIIQGLGLLILFGSWIAQNIYQNSWEDKKNRFDSNFNLLVQSQLGVFSQEIAAKSFLGLNIITKDTNYIIQANTIRYLSLYCQDYILLQKMINSTLNIDKNMLSDESYLKIWNNLKEDSIAIARNFNNKNIDSLNYYVNYYISDTEIKKLILKSNCFEIITRKY